MTLAKRKHPEADLQRAWLRWFELSKKRTAIAWACENGGKRSRIEASILKGMGVKPGMPDVHILHDGRLHMIEFKRQGGRATPIQREMAEILIKAGAFYCLCDSLDEAIAITRRWGLIRETQSATQQRDMFEDLAHA